MGIKER